MDIKGFIEWVGHNLGSATATVFPYLLVGIVALYVLALLIGYLRVSQVGVAARSHATEPVLSLPPVDEARARTGLPETATSTGVIPRGVPYCPTDRLQFPAGARLCPVCEGDLYVSCANCGTTILAADPTCYHCGTHQTLARPPDED